MNRYYEWDNFKDVYLEDSFVLGIEESIDRITFTLEMVLTENHPMYSSVREGEQYCYKKGKIVFEDVKGVKWLDRRMRPFTDANNEEDFGNIDQFELSPDGYHLSGDWGAVIIDSSPPKIVWENAEIRGIQKN